MIWSGDKYKPWGDGVIHELPTKLFTDPRCVGQIYWKNLKMKRNQNW